MHFDDFPLEIIQYIFNLCCQTVRFRIPQGPDRRRSGTTQVTLSLVCSRWRQIVLNTSTLWGDLAVFYEAGREPALGPTASFQFVQNWLNRAGMTPISLSVSINEALESQIAEISQTLLSSFHVTNLDLESFHSLLLVPTNNSPRLERLHLSLYGPARTTDTFPRLPEMPSLKELRLCLHPRDVVDLTNIYTIPWHQLRVFTLSENYWSSQMLFNILQRCKSLVECTLLVKLDYGQHENDIVLPNMETLVLDIKLGDSADPFIRSLTLPNLKSLEITSWNRYSKLPVSPEAIVITAQRSGFNKRLTYFSLSRTEQAVDVRSLLGYMPALKSVKLLGPLMFQPGTFDDLSSGTIGPQLEEISFGVMSDEEIGLLLETVGHRHEKAKTVSGITPFAFVTGQCTSESDLESHRQRAKQCSEAFNAHVAIFMTPEALMAGIILDSGESDSEFSMGSASDEESEESYIDEELGSVFLSDEESNSGEESHSFGESESHEESFEDSSSESHWESDPDVGSDSHSEEESDPDDDVQLDA
ncbi:hypothetical protein M378DRAFT_169390 [Amanita muscaria Koide BX008]|uniref:Uncharacterized protein n=1 Tax=Amanita muscaria (strain Koide BX008) TaxID=946122 RepID=A0A0C2WSK6_AMAMK|nr:hypothetical protein M378DRAFT_169390 [Amanita muscaria Koide BX008]